MYYNTQYNHCVCSKDVNNMPTFNNIQYIHSKTYEEAIKEKEQNLIESKCTVEIHGSVAV